MEHHADDGFRKKAISFLHDWLEKAAGKSTLQTATGIVELAFQDSNPVKDAFLTANVNGTSWPQLPPNLATNNLASNLTSASKDRPQTASHTPTLKSKSSRGLLRGLTRRENKAGPSESKAATSASQVGDHQKLPPGTSPLYAEIFGDLPSQWLTAQEKKERAQQKASIAGRTSNGKEAVKTVPNSSCFSASPAPAKASGSIQYNCIICKDDLSSKGVCKRHLEEQHVSPKVYRCEKCGDRFLVKAEAKKHVHECGQGVFSYTIGKPDEKKLYACEYTGDCFISLPKYVEHLLKLCEKRDARPERDSRRKLFALLDQLGLRQHATEISTKLYQSRHAWRDLRWTEAHLSKAIEQLEYATVDPHGMIELGKHADGSQKINARLYMNSLLNSGSLSRPNSSQSAAQTAARRSRSATQTTLHRSASYGTDSGSATPTRPDQEMSQTPVDQSDATPASDVPCSTTMCRPEDAVSRIASEIKKRHLSDHSRFYVPDRHPPGPPHLPYNMNTIVHPNQFSVPSISNTSLPIRTQEGPNVVQYPTETLATQPSNYCPSTLSTPTLSSDAASGSTLISNYQEPQLLTPASLDYNYWTNQQDVCNYPFTFDNNLNYGFSPQVDFYPGDASIRASSVATDQTYAVEDYSLQQQEEKFSSFNQQQPPPLSHPMAQYTFFFDDDEYHDFNGIN